MAYIYRGRRVAYDNIAVGSATGIEKTITTSPVSPTSYITYLPREGAYGGGSNISAANAPGVENMTPGNDTPTSETVAD